MPSMKNKRGDWLRKNLPKRPNPIKQELKPQNAISDLENHIYLHRFDQNQNPSLHRITNIENQVWPLQ